MEYENTGFFLTCDGRLLDMSQCKHGIGIQEYAKGAWGPLTSFLGCRIFGGGRALSMEEVDYLVQNNNSPEAQKELEARIEKAQ